MMRRVKAFGMFWYDFLIGDDWRVAVGVVLALAVTAAVAHTSVPAWWIVPVAVAMLLPFTVWRGTRSQGGSDSSPSS